MKFDTDCLNGIWSGQEHCEYQFSLDDAVGEPLRQYIGPKSGRGDLYFEVECPECGLRQALVTRNTDVPSRWGVLWLCSWNDEPCGRPNCEVCSGLGHRETERTDYAPPGPMIAENSTDP